MFRPGWKPAKRQVVFCRGRPVTGPLVSSRARTTGKRAGATIAGFVLSVAVTVIVRGAIVLTNGATTVVAKLPAGSAVPRPLASPARATGAPGVNAAPASGTLW